MTRIMGRERNMLTDALGNQYWPAFGVRSLVKIAPLKQFQLVQIDLGMVEARLVPGRPLSEDEQTKIRDHLAGRLPGGMQVQVKLVSEIVRTAGGKYEDFVNETLR